MTHCHGVQITADLPIETVVDIRDGLKSGKIKLSFGADVEVTAEVAAWRDEITAQLIDAYEAELARRRS